MIRNKEKIANIFAAIGVWGGCFVVPAFVQFFTHNKYAALAAMFLFGLIPICIAKRLGARL